MRAVDNTAKLLEVARRYNVPVACCYTAYMNEREMPYWKITAVRETFRHDHPSVALDPRIHDPTTTWWYARRGRRSSSAPAVSDYFTKERVDTVIVTGCNTSGCIRATSIDSFSYRYRTIVPEDCVGDIEEQPHWDNLRDLGRRYVDVSDLKTVLASLEDWHGQNRP